MELAIEHMQEAIHSLTKAVDVPHRAVQVSSPVEETVSYADRLLLMRRDQETAISDDQDGLSKDLIKLLYEKNAALNLSCPSIIEDGHLTPDLKRLDKGGHGEINQLDDKGFVKISCTIPISSMETASPFSEVGGSSRLGA